MLSRRCFFLLFAAGFVFAGTARAQKSVFPDPARGVLDVERLRGVRAARFPSDVPTCDVLVVGGGVGGVAAAEAAAKAGASVILVEPTHLLGGQFTSQGVATPDENRFIEREPGPSTRRYRELREQLRALYAARPGIVPGRETNVGQAWVSRVSGEVSAWASVFDARVAAVAGPRGVKRVLRRTQLLSVSRFPSDGRFHFADVVNLDTGRVTRIGAQYLLDATEWGDALPLAGLPFTVGQEAKTEHDEPHAPDSAHPEWVQSLAYCFALRWRPDLAPLARTVVPRPHTYEAFRALGEYTLIYRYSDARGDVPYLVFGRAPQTYGAFWTYRRLVAASSFQKNAPLVNDLALINWRGNDFHDESPLGKPVREQIRILHRAKSFAQGFAHWLQFECPRDDGSGVGYPEMQLDPAAMDSRDGFSVHPYVRESRRLQAVFTLTENHLATPNGGAPENVTGPEFFDTVGLAAYAIDVHPAQGEPPLLQATLPYHLPLGAFLTRFGPFNVLPAAKNWGATRLALASARMHPTEWLAGEVAGTLAAFCLENRVRPAQVRETPDLLAAFQSRLAAGGVTLRWSEVAR